MACVEETEQHVERLKEFLTNYQDQVGCIIKVWSISDQRSSKPETLRVVLSYTIKVSTQHSDQSQISH